MIVEWIMKGKPTVIASAAARSLASSP